MRIVVKVGSAVVSLAQGGLDSNSIQGLARQLAALHKAGHDVILVSSGAISAGVGRLHLAEKPTDLRLKQAAAAVGQLALMEAYEKAFSEFGIVPAQMLLTREDMMHRERYLNARNTLLKLLELKTLPIINENDCVATAEIQFGDNDALSAIIATKVDADRLILLSDVPGVFELDDKGQLTERVIGQIDKVTSDLMGKTSSVKGSKLSTGGMSAKLAAAKMATAAGIETWISSGRSGHALENIMNGDSGAGTRFVARPQKFATRHAWIAFGRSCKGILVVDEGALRAIVESHKSLLPAGVKSIKGTFAFGDTVAIRSKAGEEVARGLVNFSSNDLKLIRGRHSSEIATLLKEPAASEVIHRDNLVLL